MTLIQQINNLRKLVTINGKEYKWDAKSKTYKAVKGKAKPLTKQAAIDLVKGQKNEISDEELESAAGGQKVTVSSIYCTELPSTQK